MNNEFNNYIHTFWEHAVKRDDGHKLRAILVTTTYEL